MISLYDKEFEIIEATDVFSSLMWLEEYFGSGNFQLITSTNLNNGEYLYNGYLQKLGIIHTIIEDGKLFIYKGKMIKYILNDFVISETVNYYNKSIEFIVKDLVNKFAVGLPLQIAPNQDRGGYITVQVTGDNLLEFINTLLETVGMACTINFDTSAKTLTFEVLQGADNRTTEPPFSEEFNTIYGYQYTKSSEFYKNFAYVAGEELENQPRKIISVDLRVTPEEKLHQMWVDARDLRSVDSDGNTIPTAEYEEMLRQRGIEKLSDFKADEEIVIDVLDQKVELGELRLFKNKTLILNQRVVGILTGYENGAVKRSIDLKLENTIKGGAL